MKKIYVHGSFRGSNFGDYLLFKLADSAVKSNGCTAVYDYISAEYQALNHVETKSIAGALLSSDAVLCAGGGFFGEPRAKDYHWDLRCMYFHAAPLLLAVLLRKPIAIIGTEIGDISNPVLKLFLKRIIKNAKIVSVRNDKSLSFVKRLVPGVKAVVHPDWVLTSEFGRLFPVQPMENSNYTIFLHITKYNPEKLKELCSGINHILKTDIGIRVVVGVDHDTAGSRNTVKFLMDNLDSDAVEQYNYHTPQEFIQVLYNADCIITTKLHVGICGIRLGKAVISLPCHPKIRSFYEYIDYDMQLVKEYAAVTAAELESMIMKCKAGECCYSNTKLITDADKNPVLLSEFLKSI